MGAPRGAAAAHGLRHGQRLTAALDVVRGGGLVLAASRKWNDPAILNSLVVGDETSAYPLRDDTPSGPVWHRFTFDGYQDELCG